MNFLSHPLPFLIAYCVLQGLNALYFSLNGYDNSEILRWTWLDWMKNAWLGMSIAVVGAFISFFDQKLSRWMEERAGRTNVKRSSQISPGTKAAVGPLGPGHETQPTKESP